MDWITVGKVLRAHGVHGWMRIAYASDVWELPEAVQQLRLVSHDEQSHIAQIETVRNIHRGALLKLKDISERNGAQALAGYQLQMSTAFLPSDDADSLYVYELIGAQACDLAGNALGQVRQVVDNHGQDLLIIDSAGGERMLPLVPETLHAFDRAARVLTLCVPVGLWD